MTAQVKPKKCETPLLALYQSRVHLWIHQDRVQWGRVQWMLTIEAATLAGAYSQLATEQYVWMLLLLVLGSILLLALLGMFRKDERDRDKQRDLIDVLHDRLATELDIERDKLHLLTKGEPWWRSASKCFYAALIILFMTNFAMAQLGVVRLTLTFSTYP